MLQKLYNDSLLGLTTNLKMWLETGNTLVVACYIARRQDEMENKLCVCVWLSLWEVLHDRPTPSLCHAGQQE